MRRPEPEPEPGRPRHTLTREETSPSFSRSLRSAMFAAPPRVPPCPSAPADRGVQGGLLPVRQGRRRHHHHQGARCVRPSNAGVIGPRLWTPHLLRGAHAVDLRGPAARRARAPAARRPRGPPSVPRERRRAHDGRGGAAGGPRQAPRGRDERPLCLTLDPISHARARAQHVTRLRRTTPPPAPHPRSVPVRVPAPQAPSCAPSARTPPRPSSRT